MRDHTKLGISKAPGVHQIKPGLFRIDARRKDPRRSGKGRMKERLFEGTFREAVTARAALVLELQTATEERAKTTLEAAAKSWIELRAPVVSPATARGYADALDQHLLPALGSTYVSALTRNDVQAMINSLVAKGLSRATVHGKVRVLRNLWSSLMADDETLRDITHKLRLPTPKLRDPDDTNSLSIGELAHFLRAWASHKDEPMLWLLAMTGQRWCHVSALHWADLDIAGKRVKMMRSQTRQHVSGSNVVKRSPGWVSLPDKVMELLAAHRARPVRSQNPGLARDIMFPSQEGSYKTPNSLNKSWKKALVRAGITRRFSIHGLRRTLNDATRTAGASGSLTRAVVGHVTEGMTDLYSSVGASEKSQILAKVYSLVSGVQS